MAITRCASLGSSPLLTEIPTSSSCPSTSSFPRAAWRTCRTRILPASSALKYGPSKQQWHTNFLGNKSSTSNLLPAKKSLGILIRAHHVEFQATRKVTIPFKEGVLPANQYLEETERIVRVTFPDSSRIEYVGDETWRSHLRPITFISITATPIVEMRVTFEDGALRLYSDNLVLDFTGVPESFVISNISFLLDGNMRATSRSAATSTVRHDTDFAGSVTLRLSTDLPAAFSLIPKGIVTAIGDEILDRIIGAMEGALLQGIIRDYKIWCRMTSRKSSAGPRQLVEPLRTSPSS